MGQLLRKIGQLTILSARRFVAVDFDGCTLRLAAAETTVTGVRLDKLVECALAEGSSGEDPAAVGALLGAVLDRHNLQSLPMVMDVPRGKALLKPLTLPAGIEARDLAAAVHFQVEKELPFRPEEAVVDFAVSRHVPAAGEGGGVGVLAAAAPVAVVDFYKQVAATAGVKLLRLGLRPYADLQAMLSAGLGAGEAAVAMVHLTPVEAEIDIVERGDLVFTRSAAVKLRSAAAAGEAGAAEMVETVVREVSRTLQSYQPLEGHGRVLSAVIAGGTGLEGRVARELARVLNVPCPTFRPGAGVTLPRDPVTVEAFPAVLGLALGHAGESLPLDFLNPKRPLPRRNVRRARLIAVGALGGGVGVLLAIVGALYVGSAAGEAADLREQLRKLEERNKAVLELKARQEAIGDWLALGFNWLEHWSNIAHLAPPADELYVDSLAFDNRGFLGRSRTPAGRVLFTAHARTPQALERFMQALQQAGYRCKTSGGSADRGAGGYPHTAAMEVLIEQGMKVNPPPGPGPARPAGDCTPEQFAEGKR